MKVQFLSFLISLYHILCLKTPLFLVHKYYECFYLLNSLQNPWQVMVLCLAVTQVCYGWCNPALGMHWVCTTGIFYVWYSEPRVALVESPLDHCFFSPRYKLHPLDVVTLPMQIILSHLLAGTPNVHYYSTLTPVQRSSTGSIAFWGYFQFVVVLLVGKKALCCGLSSDGLLCMLKLKRIYPLLCFTKKLF